MKKSMLYKVLVLMMAILFPSVVSAGKVPDEAQKEQILKQAQEIRIPFIENKGQVKNDDVKFYASTFGGTIFVEKNGALTYSLPADEKKGAVIREIFTDKQLNIEGLDPAPTQVSYFKGKDQKNWKSDIPSYNRVSLGEVYKGIEVSLKASGNNVEKLFKILSNQNPEQIKIQVDGCRELRVNETGELEAITDLGAVKFTKPVAFQEINGKKQSVEVAYAVMPENTYGFQIGDYDKELPLIIDPLLAGTFIGGSNIDQGMSIALDGSGNVYVTGLTASSDFPTTSGVYDESFNGVSDAFISKFNSSLSTLLASTFLGGSLGSNIERSCSIALDDSGNVYVAGYTGSSDFPTTSGAYDESFNGVSDAFISKFNSSLSTLLASTFLGESNTDSGNSIALDASGNVYVTGRTMSSDFPTTSGAYDESFNGGFNDAFISKFNSSLSTLLASTFIGGSGEDFGNSIALDGSGNIYVTGSTGSSDFPTTSGAYDESWNGVDDAFISKFNSSLSALLASTFLGESNTDSGNSIALDVSGNVYVTGATGSLNFPTTSGAYDESFNGVNDAFISKFNSSLSTLLASTLLGGSDHDQGMSIALDISGNVYVTGATGSLNFPTTSGAYDESFNGVSDAFISRFNSSLSTLLAGTFIGGLNNDYGNSIALDGSGNVYVTCFTYSSDFPTTSGAYDESYNGGTTDAYITKLDSNLSKDATGIDNDGDDYTVNEGDCDDNDATIHPGADEICGDGKDNNCNGVVDEGCSGAISDTGQTKCYNNTVEISCPSPGQAFYGQDSNYNINPMSFTKLDSSGNPISDDAPSWDMVRDNFTGLIWEEKQDMDGVENYSNPHDADNSYTWYDSNPATNGGYAGTPGDGTDTEDFINALNAANYGGHHDWHMPTIKELASIVNYGAPGPGPIINTAYFSNTQSDGYWSSTTYSGDTYRAWYLDFSADGGRYYFNKSEYSYVRAVCGGQSGSLDHLVDNLDNTVTDTETGLMWQQATAPGTYTWEQALAYAETLGLAGYNDWRLPTIKELQSLVDYTQHDPAIDSSMFPDTQGTDYWSSTTNANWTSLAWRVNFSGGYDNNLDKSFSSKVRAVRGGQSGSLGHLVISSPKQASAWDSGALMLICWGTEGLGTNVKISLSRQGGLDGSFETIVDTTPNDGQYEWTITGPASVNCVIKIEQADNTSNWAAEGLFVIETQCHRCDLDCDGDVDIMDIMMVAARWNTSTGDPNYAALCDLDNDGDIDIMDIMIVAAQWGWTE